MNEGGTAKGCALGCLGVVGAFVFIGGLNYWFGKPWCIDSACTDTGSVGPVITIIGAFLTLSAILGARGNKK